MAASQFDAVRITFRYGSYLLHQSGVIMNDYVITSGGLVFPYVFSGAVECIHNFEITVAFQKDDLKLRGFITYLWQSEELKNAIVRSNLGFDFFNTQSYSYFLVIALNHCTRGNISEFHFTPRRTILYKGMNIMTASTPFGSPLFMNSFTQGIVSNVLENTLFITDARLSHGCQGGPVFQTANYGHSTLVGIILTPFIINGEYTGFTLCCNIFSIYESYCRNRCLGIQNIYLDSGSTEIHRIADSVLPIRTPSTRGSSVLINENGLLVTCGHVIKFDVNIPVQVDFGGRSFEAKVLCTSSPDDILDIAFLQIYANFQFPACRFYELIPMKGTPVYMIGYEKVHDNFIQLISKGTILTHENQGPVYTSCISNRGKSGGGVFLEDGRLLAIVIGVMSFGTKGIIHKWHGICVPVNIIAEPLSHYYQTGDLSFLENLCKTRDLPLPKWDLLIKKEPVCIPGFETTNENFIQQDGEGTGEEEVHANMDTNMGENGADDGLTDADIIKILFPSCDENEDLPRLVH